MKVVAIKQTKSSKNIHFITDEYNEYSLEEILKIGEKNVLENVQIISSKSGKQYLRSRSNKNEIDNLENLAITCNEKDFLLFDREYLYLKTINGRVKKQWKAWSGNEKSTILDQDKEDFGPLPEGEYTVRFDKTLDFKNNTGIWDAINWLRKATHWGFVATPLEPSIKNQMFHRGNFFIHGGLTKGTKGCIEINFVNAQFHCFMRLYKRNFKLIVKY